MLVLPVRTSGSLLAAPRRQGQVNRTAAVCKAAKGSSPWASNPGGGGGRAGGSSGGQPKKKAAAGGGDSSSKKGSSKAGSSSKGSSPKKPKSSSSGQGFGPKQVPPPPPTYKITPPLTPQLLDELSAWETAAAPLWGTFTGHCEGEWLGQYGAYTPWGGDPEPVWADESGAYLTCAFCRVTEERQAVPADAAAAVDSSTDEQDSSSSTNGGGGLLPQQQGQEAAAPSGETLDLLVRSTQRSASISSLIGGVSAAAAAAAAAATSAGAAGSSAQPVGGADSQAAAAAGASSSSAAEDEELEAIAYNINGSVVFNGGSYSLGPEVIQVPELDAEAVADYYDALEAAAAAGADPSSSSAASAGADSDDEEQQDAVDPLSTLPFSTVVLEQALVTSGDRRLRLVATLKVRRPPGQELDIEIARLLLYREFWYGTTDNSSSTSASSSKRLQLLPAHKFDVPVTDLPRPQPSDLAGTWNVFVLAANLAVEENPNTLQDETVVLYSSREERQHWHVPTITSSAAPVGSSSNGGSGTDASQAVSAGVAAAAAEQGADSDAADAGGSFWLPGGAVVTLRMVATTGSDGDGDLDSSSSSSTNGTSSSSSSGKRAPQRGLMIGLHMLDGAAGSCLFVEREYDAEGVLLEVRQGSAVKGGWSGGRM